MHRFLYRICIREIVIAQKGVKPPILKNEPFENSVPYLDINTLETGNIKEYANKDLVNIATKEDIFVVWDGSRSGLTFKGREGAIGSTIMMLTPINVDPEYLYYFIKSKFEFINKNTTGSGIPHVNSNVFFEIKIPYIPIDDQKLVISELKEKTNRNKIFIEKQKKVIREVFTDNNIQFFEDRELIASIDKFKETILQRAFSGELTKNWRIHKGISESTWSKQSISDISHLVTSGSRDWTKYYSTKGARFIRTQDIKDNYINKANMIYVNLPKNVEGKRAFVESGDLLFTIVGSNIGKCAIVEDNFGEEGYVNQAIALVKLNKNVNGHYLHLYFQSPEGQNQIRDKIYGDAQPDLSLSDVRSLEVSLPSMNEQLEIIEQANVLLKLIENIKDKYLKTLSHIEDLEKSLLEQAFNGDEIESTLEHESRISILKNIQLKRKILEAQLKIIKAQQNSKKKFIKNMIIPKKSLEDILKESPSLTTEELWKESVYFLSKDVESFYIELIKLKNDNKIVTTFTNEKKDFTLITLK